MTLLLVRDGREFLCEPGDELQTDLGVLTVPPDATPGDSIETHLGESFRVRRLRGPELFDHLERTGAPMVPKDIGLIIGHTGIQADDRVLDVGTGTGVLAVYLGRLQADVISYEVDPDFARTARDNMAIADVGTQVDVRTGDATELIDEIEPVDVMTLDTGDAPELIEYGPEILRSDGRLAVYSPFVEDAKTATEVATSVGYVDVETYETFQRAMDFDDRGSRPSTAGVGHTGYLTFGRLD